MSTPLPPNPYLALGVSKSATLAEIRSAHRKLVIKCHPDKVQDPALKAVKQEEFHKVQQAYELLSDDAKRTGYDEQVKLMELRKEMGRSGPAAGAPPGKTVFDYEVREAAPRSSTFAKSQPKTEPTRVYQQSQPPRSFEDDLPSRMYDEPVKGRARKTASYEEPRKTAREEEPRRSAREEEKRRRAEDERAREKAEKDGRKNARSSDKKSRDKDRRKGTEEKRSTRTNTAHVTDESSDEPYRPVKAERKSTRRVDDEEATRQREKARAAEKATEQALLTQKLQQNMGIAAQYMAQASRRKPVPVEPAEEEFRPKPIRRAETFQGTTSSYSTPRYASASYPPVEEESEEEEDWPRRSSARSSPRRASEQVPPSSRSSREVPRPSVGSRKPSTAYDAGKPYIVDAAPRTATAAPSRKPPMPSHTSAPANLHNMTPAPPSRARTMPAAYAAPPPPLGRSQTFQSGDSTGRPRPSNLSKTVEHGSEDSESDGRSPSPPRRHQEPVRYIISKDRNAIPVDSRRRPAARDDDYEYPRERSESPRGNTSRRATERPSLTRSSASSKPSSSRAQAYYPSSPPEQVSMKSPIVKDARPKLPPRESATSTRGPGAYFGEVKYAPSYGPEHVTYAPEGYRRGNEPYSYPASRREAYT